MPRNEKKIDEPQDVAELGPTPYEFLFGETAEKIKGFVDEVKEFVEDKDVSGNNQ